MDIEYNLLLMNLGESPRCMLYLNKNKQGIDVNCWILWTKSQIFAQLRSCAVLNFKYICKIEFMNENAAVSRPPKWNQLIMKEMSILSVTDLQKGVDEFLETSTKISLTLAIMHFIIFPLLIGYLVYYFTKPRSSSLPPLSRIPFYVYVKSFVGGTYHRFWVETASG